MSREPDVALGRALRSARRDKGLTLVQPLGPDHPDTLMSINNLANLLRELGRYPEAIALQVEALAKQKDRLGPDHPDTLLSSSNLAISYQNAGRLQ